MKAQLNDQALEYLKCRSNPFYFIYNYVEIPEIGGSLKLSDANLHNKIKRVVRCTIKYNRVILMASRQLGKALDINTKIPLFNGGYKLMGDLEIGDIIFDHKRNSTEVIATTNIMYNRPCYELEFDNGEIIVADANHLWRANNGLFTTANIYKLKTIFTMFILPNGNYIKSIKQTNSVPVRCIQVSNEDGMFLCGESGIPTHNSTIAAAMLLWATNFYAGLPAIILNMRQVAALENLNKIKFMHSKLPEWLKSPIKGRAERKTYFELQNGSIVRTFYPSSTTPADQLARSLTAPILYIDECAFINHIGLAYRSAQPVLSKARQQAIQNGYPYFILLTSTPNGIYGNGKFFYDYWENAIDSDEIFDDNENIVSNVDDFLNIKEKNSFVRIKYHWSEDPTKDNDWYDTQKRELNHDLRSINQELDLFFIGSTTCIFTDDFLSNLKPKKPIELINLRHASNLKLYSELNDKDYYIIGIDSAKSLTGDFCSIEIFSYKNFVQVGEFFGKLGSLTKFTEIIFDVLNYVNIRVNSRFILAIENNNVGSAIIENIENDGIYNSYIYSDKSDKYVYGLNTNSKTKDIMVSLFYDYINNNPGHIKSADLIGQLSVIEKKANGSISSKNGYHDDLFMASCFCAYVKKQTLLEIGPLLELDQETIDNEDEYLITNLAYNNKSEVKNKFSLFPNAESYIYTNLQQEEKEEEYEDGSDLIDFISL